jgi:hypothetical protein
VAIVASTGDVALADGATTEAATEDFAVGSVTVTPVAVDVPSVAVDVASVAVGVASVGVDMPSVMADVAPVVADMPSVAADVAPVVAEAEAVVVVGAGRFRHNSKLSRPTAFAVGRCVGRYRLRLLERFLNPLSSGSQNDVIRGPGA